MSLKEETTSSAPTPKTVAVIGAGPLGRWLALAAARAGFRVMLEDVMPSNLHHAQEELRRQLSPPEAGAGIENIAFMHSIEDAVREADLAIDCVPDELESKLEILWLLDRMAPPRTVLATPTTNLSIADLANCTYRPEKCIAMALDPRAFTGPPESGKIVLRSTSRTDAVTVALVRELWQALGFKVSVEAAEA